MNMFWPLAIALSVLALLFIVPPLLSKASSRGGDDDDRLAGAVLREQLVELEADLRTGALAPDAYAAAHSDAERALLDSVAKPSASRPREARSGRWVVLLLIPLVPLLAMGVYQQLGVGPQLEQQLQVQSTLPGAADAAPEHSMQAMVAKLAERVNSQPDNVQGWLLLARSYAMLRQFDKALEALQHARALTGDMPDLLVEMADLHVANQQGEFTDEVRQLLAQALAQQPDNVKGLWLMGHWQYRQGELRQAVQTWQKVAQHLPADGPEARALADDIRLAQNQLGDGTAPDQVAVDPISTDRASTDRAIGESVATAKGTAARGVQVRVSLDPAIADKAAPTDTLFIFARAPEGSRMPLAIVRKQVRDLPLSLTLDDSMAMLPTRLLSQFKEIAVGARISKSGAATPAPGDLEVIAEAVRADRREPVELRIDSVLN